MEVGKLRNDCLQSAVIDAIKPIREDVLIRPSVGEDCGAIAFGDFACVLTTDPITGSGAHLGKLAVDVCVNDIASSGATPVGILLTLLCPVGTTTTEINGILTQANAVANSMNIEILGGHTEITSAVNKIVVSATAIGKIDKKMLIRTGGGKPEDLIYVTKSSGIEGTAIIATDKAIALKSVLSICEIEEAQNLIHQTSVLKEGIIGGRIGASAMHDATEGGVIGAIHEVCEASGTGCSVSLSKFRILPVTEKICKHFNIEPLKLISSGAMVIVIAPSRASELERQLQTEGVDFACVGRLTEALDKVLIDDSDPRDVKELTIDMPESDELYKVVG